MRSSVLLLAALCLCATRVCAETGVTNDAPTRILLGSSKKDKTKPKEQGAQQPPQSDASAPEVAPEREMSADDAIFSASTPMPVMKIVGPVVGGVIGAGALAGVIAMSVMKKPKAGAKAAPTVSTASTEPVAAGATVMHGSTAGFHLGKKVDIDPGTAVHEVATIQAFGSFTFAKPLKFAHAAGAVISEAAPAAAKPAAAAPAIAAKPAAGAPPAISAKLKAAAPAPLAETTLTKAVAIGDTSIEIASVAGFTAGDTIKVGDEYQLVKGFGSVLLDHPMNSAQPLGAAVKVINDVATTPAPTAAPTPAPTVAPVVPVVPVVTPAPVLPGPISTNTTTPPYTSSSGSHPPSGSARGTVIGLTCMLVGCCLVSVAIGVIVCCFCSRKKKRKTQPRKEPSFDEYEDQQPMMSTMVDMRQREAQDLCESQYMQVPPLVPQYNANIGSVPTMQNVVPMQTMPPPPPLPMSMSYQPPAQGGSLFSQGSYYQNASPLANTVNSLPPTQFSQFAPAQSQYGAYGLPPTIY